MDFHTTFSSAPLAAAVLALTGILAGLCGGFWGLGAGWMVVPILVLAGVPANVAIGCSVLHMAAKSVYPTIMRWRQMDWRPGGFGRRIGLPLTFIGAATAVLGVLLVDVSKHARGGTGRVVGICYVILLAVISARSIIGFLHHRRTRHERPPGRLAGPTGALIIGGLAGALNGFLGVGGGVLGRPAMRYLMRVPEVPTAAISQFAVLVTSIVGAAAHWHYGNIAWPTVIALSCGGIIGQWLGTIAHRHAHGPESHDWAAITFGVAALGILAAQVLALLQLDRFGHVWVVLIGIAITVMILWATAYEHKRAGNAARTGRL